MVSHTHLQHGENHSEVQQSNNIKICSHVVIQFILLLPSLSALEEEAGMKAATCDENITYSNPQMGEV